MSSDPQPIVNDTTWRTVAGSEIRANGGSVLRVGSTFYWYGVNYDGSFQEGHFAGQIKVGVYSSSDLSHWTLERAAVTSDRTTGTNKVTWLGRPDVIYNTSTKQYVMVLSRSTGPRNRLAFYTSSSPTGLFQRHPEKELALPDGRHTMGDKGLFQDADGTAYVLYVADVTTTNSNIEIARLSADYLGTQQILSSCGGGHREAPTALQRNGQYYLFASETRSWRSSRTWYKAASSMGGFSCDGGQDGHGWNVLATEPASDNSFNTQHGNILTVVGRQGTTWVVMGDRWSQFDQRVGGTGRVAWFPLVFNDQNHPVLIGTARWRLSVGTGTWTR